MRHNMTTQRITKTALSLAILGLFAVLAAGTAPSEESGPASSSQAPSSTPKTYTYITDSCAEMSNKFGAQSDLSDLQKEELWKSYDGKAFKWDLEVTEVSSDTFGGYSVQFKCANDSPSFIQDIQLKYQDEHKNVVMQMNKGEVYTVRGQLEFSNSFLGMSGDAIVQ
jgi:hypothetical protein